jgi:hypothetical protein
MIRENSTPRITTVIVAFLDRKPAFTKQLFVKKELCIDVGDPSSTLPVVHKAI